VTNRSRLQVIGNAFYGIRLRWFEVSRVFSVAMATSDEVLIQNHELSRSLGKDLWKVNAIRLVANRILNAMIQWSNLLPLFERGSGRAWKSMYVMKLGMAHRWATPMADFIGLDVCLSILKLLHEGFGNPKICSIAHFLVKYGNCWLTKE